MAAPGVYYGPSGFQELKGAPTVAKIAPAAKDAALAKRLWIILARRFWALTRTRSGPMTDETS
jgi:hypothetical protein